MNEDLKKKFYLDEVMSVKKASEKLKLSKVAISKAIHAKKIRGIDMDGMFYIPNEDVEKYKHR